MKLSHTMSSREQVLPICSALINGVLFFLYFLKSAPVRGQLEIVFLFFDFVSSCRTNGAKFGTSCYGVFICSQGMLSKIARHILTPYYCSMWGKLKKIQKMDLQYSMALATVMESLARWRTGYRDFWGSVIELWVETAVFKVSLDINSAL